MGQLAKQDTSNTSYVDFSYRGFLFSEAQTIYNVLQISIQPLTPIVSTSEYPLGNISSLYPLGSLISLKGFPYSKIKIKIKWKVTSGSLFLTFLTVGGVVIPNSGIYTTSLEYETYETIIDIPATAEFITLWNKNSPATATVDYIELYSVEQVNPLGLSKLLLTDVDALKNALKMWLFSKRGDYGRKIGKGGPLDEFLGKPVNAITKEDVVTTLKDTIEKQFYNLTAQEIQVEMIPENRQIRINLYISDNINKFLTNIPIILQQEG